MKSNCPILLTLLLLISFNCVAQNPLLEKYSKMEDVTTVYISKSMLQLMPQMNMPMDMDLHDLSGRLTGLLILTSEKESIIRDMRKETAEFFNEKTYEVLMKIKDDDSLVNFYIRRKKDQHIAELVMLVDDGDEFVIIQMTGDLTNEDIKKMSKGMDIEH